MTYRRLGSMQVHRVEELGRVKAIPLDALLPGSSPEELSRQHRWLSPHHLDLDSGTLINTFQSWILQTDRHVVVVDTCCGNHRARPTFPPTHNLDTPYLANLASTGVKPEDVDFVMCTHLHVDHVGWNTLQRDGKWRPTFPNAKYIFGKVEFAEFEAEQLADPDALVNHGSFRDSVMPIVEASLAHMIDGEHEITDGVIAKPAAGHTAGHYMLEAKSGGSEGWFTGDVMHHPLQIIHPMQNSPFCALPEQARETRHLILAAAADRDVTVFPAHFELPHAVRIGSTSNGFEPIFE